MITSAEASTFSSPGLTQNISLHLLKVTPPIAPTEYFRPCKSYQRPLVGGSAHVKNHCSKWIALFPPEKQKIDGFVTRNTAPAPYKNILILWTRLDGPTTTVYRPKGLTTVMSQRPIKMLQTVLNAQFTRRLFETRCLFMQLRLSHEVQLA